jgi:hypothetical protein
MNTCPWSVQVAAWTLFLFAFLFTMAGVFTVRCASSYHQHQFRHQPPQCYPSAVQT